MVTIFIFLLSGFVFSENNACVSCHAKLEATPSLEHNFQDWQKSIHARGGVACEACHNGNPALADKLSAHGSLKSSSNDQSPVYFTRVPATCGACHQAEFQAFKASAHYKELQKSGRGPNCVTCHGSMANHVLEPRELEMTCALCHRKPTNAYATLTALNGLTVKLKILDAALREAKRSNIDMDAQETAGKDLADQHKKALANFHTFKMEKTLRLVQEAGKKTSETLTEIELKAGQTREQPKQ